MSNFSASVPVAHAEAANLALGNLGWGFNCFSRALMPDANGATHLGFHCWDNPAFKADVEALPVEYGIVIRDEAEEPETQFTALAQGIGIPWPPDPDWMLDLPGIGDEREVDGVLWRSTMEGNPFLPPYGWELVPVDGPIIWEIGMVYTQPTTVTGADGTPGEGRTWTLVTASETATAGREPWNPVMWAVWEEVV